MVSLRHRNYIFMYMFSRHDVPGPGELQQRPNFCLHLCENRPMLHRRNMHICAEKKNWTHVFAITSCLRPMYQRIWCVPHSTLRELSFCIRHWLSKYILLILQIKTSLQAERKRNGKTYHARLQVALHTQIGSDCRCQQGFDEERHLGIVLKWIHIPCEILVK